MRRTLIFAFIYLLSITGKAQMREVDVSYIKNKFLDIPYATISEAQKLDIYLPDDGDRPFPVILYIHGGGFMAGDKRQYVQSALKGLKRGYAVVSINYRLSGESIWPAQIHDCKAAVRWIKANAGEYKLNPNKIVAWGGSAGGHLSALLGTSGDIKSIEDLALGNPKQSSRVQAVVDWFGPTNFLKMDEQLYDSGIEDPMQHSVPDSPESLLLGINLPDAPELVEEANPETYVSSDDPPFFIQHGMEDNLVPYQGSVLLARKLGKEIGFENVYLELFPATGHGGAAFYQDENFGKIFSFINKHLKGGNHPGKQIDRSQIEHHSEEGFIEIDGSKLEYVVEGDGIPCLVIGSSVYYPKTFSKDLKKHLKMYFVDMRWFAKERGTIRNDSFSINTIINDIEQIRKYFNLKDPIIMGHSIHGTIAMEYAKKYPDSLSALVMIGSPNIYGNETYAQMTAIAWETASKKRKELQKNNWSALYKIKDNFTDAELIVEEYCTMAPTYWFNPTYDSRWLWEDMTIHADLIHHLYGRVFSNYFMFGDLQVAPVPTLAVLGKHDYAIPPLLWERDKNVKNLTIKILKHSGHTPQLEESEIFNEELLQWLNSK